jgi:hypothetical protein
MSDVFLQKKAKRKSLSIHHSRNRGNSALDKTLLQNGKPLSGTERTFYESRFGYDFSEIRLHDNKPASDAAQKIDARAFTLGNNIFLGNAETSSFQRKNLMAHELTHVIQQAKANGSQDNGFNAENEADLNGQKIFGNEGISVHSKSSPGKIQRKPKSKVSVESSGTKKKEGDKPAKGENKYTFSAETKLPLPGSRKYGKLSLLDDLKLKISGEKSGEEPISAPVDLETLKLKLALEIAKLEFESVKSTRFGKFSAGTKIGSDASLTLKYGKGSGIEGEVGGTAGFSLGYKTPNLIPGRFGSLGAETTLGATGSITGTAGNEESKFVPKLGGKAAFGLKYSSPSFRGGPLGDKATVDIGAGTAVSGSLTPEKRGIKAEGSGEIGLTGKSKGGIERFVKVKLTRDVTIDQKAGEARTHGGSLVIGGFIGGNF